MKRASIVLVACLFLLSLVAVADTVNMKNMQVTPAAVGKIEPHHDRNGNVVSDIHVWHLAHPQQLLPAKSVYVVWIQGAGRAPENEGALRLNENLEGTTSVKAPYHQYDVFITAEDSPVVTMPSGPEILRATIVDDKNR